MTLVFVFGLPCELYALDWLQWRGDSQRSGHIAGTMDLESPGVRWRSSAGGVLSGDALADVDGDGTSDLVTVEGGRVVARSPTGSVFWDTPGILAERVEWVANFDGKGGLEVLVRRANGALLLSLSSGQVLWESSVTLPMEQVGSLLWEDLDGDGRLEVLLADQAMNASKPHLKGTVFVFRFDEGWGDGMPSFVTEEDTRDYEVGRSVAVGDINGDGVSEIVVPGKHFVYAYSGIDGTLLYASEDLSGVFDEETIGVSDLQFMDVDEDGDSELFLFSNTVFVGKPTRRVAAFDRKEQVLTLLWTESVSDPQTGTHHWTDGALVSLGPTDKPAVISSFFGVEEGWVTTVRDSLTGEALHALPGMRALAFEDLDGDGSPELRCGASAVQSPGQYEPQVFWSLDEENATQVAQVDGSVLGSNFGEVLTAIPNAIVVTSDVDKDGWGDKIQLYDFPSLEPLASRDVATLSVRLARDSGEPALFVYGPLGRMGLYDSASLTLQNDGNGDGLPDLEVGGFGVTRVVASGSIVAHGRAGGRVVVVDGSDGDPIESPQALFEASGSINQQPVLFRSAQGMAVLILTQDPEDRSLLARAYSVETGFLWEGILGGIGGIYNVNRDVLVADLNGDDVDDLVLILDQTVQSHIHRVVALDGATGNALWAPQDVETPGGGIGQLSLSSDGSRLYLVGNKTLYEWDVASGTSLGATENNQNHYYGTPISIDIEGDGTEELVLIGTNKGAYLLEADRTMRWVVDLGSSTRASGAIMPTDEGPLLALAQYKSPVVTFVDGAGQILVSRTLAFGALYTEEETPPEDAAKAHIQEILTIEDLQGDGKAAFILTSSDGYIYAMDGSGGLVWSRPIGGAVGAPAAFDADGDGVLELLVPSKAGDILALDQTVLTAPEWVHDVDSGAVGEAVDIDEQETCFEIALAWAPVEGATAYQASLYTENGTLVSQLVSDGPEPSIVFSDLKLNVGTLYFSSVLALSITETGKVSGPVRQSDGVTPVDTSDPEVLLFSVTPDVLAPSGGTSVVTVAGEAVDSKGIETYLLGIRSTETEEIWVEWSAAVGAPMLEIEWIWDGLDDSGEYAPSGPATAYIRVVDYAGKTAEAEASFYICTTPAVYDLEKEACVVPPQEVEVDVFEPDVVDVEMDAGSNVGGVQVAEMDTIEFEVPAPVGCACQETPQEARPWSALLWFVGMMLAMAGLRRRALTRPGERGKTG